MDFINKEDHCLQDLADEDYLHVHVLGPYYVWDHQHLRDAVTILLAVRRAATVWPAWLALQQEDMGWPTV